MVTRDVRPLVIAVVALAAALVSACGAEPTAAPPSPSASAETSSPAPAPVTTTTTAPPTTTTTTTTVPPSTASVEPGTMIITGDSELGQVLFDATGQAIYLFDVETGSVPACYDACAVDWPPVLTDGPPAASAGADPALLGTTARSDGTTQVTYAGHPLYFYAHEGKHEVLCHDFVEYGGTWYALAPEGGPAPS